MPRIHRRGTIEIEYVIERETKIPDTDKARVWRDITSWVKINDELWPLNMTHPDSYPSVADIPPDGRVHFVSKIRLGFLPIDFHHISFVELVDESLFDECSSNLLLRKWTHRRTLVQDGDAVIVRDRCTLTPRMRALGPLLARVYGLIFTRRHQQLQARSQTT